MARVIFTEDATISAMTATPVTAPAQVTKVYFAEKVVTGTSKKSTATASSTSSSASSGGVTHTVKDKETLYSIHVKHNVPVKTIQSLNSTKYPKIKNNTINKGDVLIIKKSSEKVSSSSAKTHVVVTGDTVYNLTNKYGLKKGELRTLNGLKSDALSKGQKLKVSSVSGSSVSKSSSSSKGGKKLTFKKIDQASMSRTVYVVVETTGLRKKKVQLEVRQAGTKTIADKNAAVKVVNQKKAVATMTASIGEMATKKYSNDDDLKDIAIFKIRLDPNEEKSHKAWVDAINKNSDKTTKLYLNVDLHTPNNLKASSINYQGKKVGSEEYETSFLSDSGKEFKLDTKSEMHIYHTGHISKIELTHAKKVKMIYHDKNDKQHELCEVDVLVVDKRKNGQQLKDIKDKVTKKIIKVQNLTLPKEKAEKTVAYSGTGVSCKKSHYYKNGLIYSVGKKYRKSAHVIKYRKASGKTVLLAMADPLSYSKNGVTVKYKWHETKRKYCGPYEYAGFLGACAAVGKTITCGGSSYKDSTAFPSLEHCNGEAVDTNYLSSKTDQQTFITTLHKFGFGEHIIATSKKFTHAKPESSRSSLHDTHLHSGEMKPNFK